MSIGKSASTKIRHWIGLAPDYVIEHPIAQILKNSSNSKNVVITADDPQGTIRLKNSASGS